MACHLFTETERSSGWQPWYSLETLKLVFNVSSEYQGCHPDDLFVSVFGIMPLPETMLIYCQLDPWEQTSVKFESKCTENAFKIYICLLNVSHFVQASISTRAMRGSHALNMACRSSGHYWYYYPGALSFKSSHCNSFEDWAPVDEIYGARSSNELHRFDNMTGYQ